MDTWSDIRRHLEADDDPTLAEVLASLSPADRTAAGPTWFARMVAQGRPRWQRDALCAEPHPGVTWFPSKGQPTGPAKAVCRRCLCREDCLEYAVVGHEVGVWGGTSDRERTAMRVAGHEAA